MGFCRTAQILFSLLLCTINVFGQMNFIEVRLVNETDIIGNISFTTITSSLMKCSEHEECSVIGFTNDPTVGRNSDCLLLKKAESSFTEEAKGLVPLFVILGERKTDQKKPVIPDCRVHGGWSSWGSPSTCSTTCGPGTSVVTRTCTNPAPQRGGFDCKGDSTLNENCEVHPCPADYCKKAIERGASTATLNLYDNHGAFSRTSFVHCLRQDGYYYTACQIIMQLAFFDIN